MVFRGFGQEQRLHFLELIGLLRREVVVLGIILGDVVKLPVVVSQRGHRGSQQPGRDWRCRGGNPAIMVNRAVADHLKILRLMIRRRIGIRLVERIHHAHAFNWLLRNAVDGGRRLDAGGF